MTYNKVTLPKVVAEAIESIKLAPNGQAYNIQVIFSNALNTPDSPYGVIKRWVSRNENEGVDAIPLYFQALVNGYTVEKSPEVNVREYYDRYFFGKHTDGGYHDGYEDGVADAIQETLNILGIKIEGVNA